MPKNNTLWPHQSPVRRRPMSWPLILTVFKNARLYTLTYVKWIASGNLLYHSGSQTRALWQPRGVGWGGRWEKGSRRRGHMYTYGWSMLMYGRNQHNTVIILQLNKLKINPCWKSSRSLGLWSMSLEPFKHSLSEFSFLCLPVHESLLGNKTINENSNPFLHSPA